jgi:nicotinamidase-related amidase
MRGAAALVLIDLQKAIDDPVWGVRNHPHAERRAQRLLTLWRLLGWPLFHIRHDSREAASTYRPGQPGHGFKPETAPAESETVLGKWTCSAFASTDLEARVRAGGAEQVFVCGVTTNNSVEATVRAGGDLGLSMYLVEDACFTFGKGRWTAQDVHEMSLANLEREYATITTSTRLLSGYLESLFSGAGAEVPLRAAEAAKKAKASDATVLAALLSAGGGVVPAALLRPLGFGEGVCSLAEQRGQTLRYLAARDAARQGLSAADLREVERLGGPMNETDAEIFGDRPSTFTLLRLRHSEEQARLGGPAPAGFSAYRAMLESHLNGTPSQQA